MTADLVFPCAKKYRQEHERIAWSAKWIDVSEPKPSTDRRGVINMRYVKG